MPDGWRINMALNVGVTGMFACGLAGAARLLCAVAGFTRAGKFALLIVGRFDPRIWRKSAADRNPDTGTGAGLLPRSGKVMMSWNGMAIYGALAAGAPLGFADPPTTFGFAALAGTTMVYRCWHGHSTAPCVKCLRIRGRPSLWAVELYHKSGLGLAFAGRGFTSSVRLFHFIFVSNGWTMAGFRLTAFGGTFVLMRILFGWMPDRFGGVKVAIVSYWLNGRGCCSCGWRRRHG